MTAWTDCRLSKGGPLLLSALCLALGCSEDLEDPAGCRTTCVDCCCPAENGVGYVCGGCSCHPLASMCACCGSGEYTCTTAVFLEPGRIGARPPGFSTNPPCTPPGGAANSFWYEGTVAVEPPPPVPDPCPGVNPCCHDVRYPVGFHASDGYNERFVPLDTTALPGVNWGCAGTNCGVTCTPSPGTIVRVHVRWDPFGYVSALDRFLVEEICSM
jgi:hypothetical protein